MLRRRFKSLRDTNSSKCSTLSCEQCPEIPFTENQPLDQNYLLKLPVELRLIIYKFTFEPYLSAKSWGPVGPKGGKDLDKPRLWAGQSEAIRPCIQIDTALLRTCKFIHNEAVRIVNINANLVHRLEIWILPEDKTRLAEETVWRIVPTFQTAGSHFQWMFSVHDGLPRALNADTSAIAPINSVSGTESTNTIRNVGSHQTHESLSELQVQNQEATVHPQSLLKASMMQCETIRMDLVSFILGGCLSFSGRFPLNEPSPLFRMYAGAVRRLVLEVCLSKDEENAEDQVQYTEESIEALLPCASPLRVCNVMSKVEEIVLEVWRRMDSTIELNVMPELGWQIEKHDGSIFSRVPELDDVELISAKSHSLRARKRDVTQWYRIDRVVWQSK